MKKTILFFCASLLIVSVLKSQTDYKVIKVNGTIKIVESGVALSQGSSFQENNMLDFVTNNARAAVINPQKGRFVLTAGSHDLASAGSNFLPTMNNISSRAGAILTMLDLQNHFKDDYVIIEQSELVLNSQIFPMNDSQFFFLQYKYNEETINKKLEFINDSLLLIKKSIYKIDGQLINTPDNTKVKLFYRDKETSRLVNEFNLIFPDASEFKIEIEILLNELNEKSIEEKLAEINGYISDFYGQIDIDNLKWWLAINFEEFKQL